MTLWTLVLRSLRHHARSHAGTALGAAVGSAILTGALLVGDSVRGSLRDLALARLGSTGLAAATGDRFFRAALARELETALGTNVAPVLQLEATVTGAGESARANRVRLLGVDERFWRLAERPPTLPSPGADEVLLNVRLARQLQVQPGDTVLIRFAKPSALSREAPLTPQDDTALARRLTVAGIVPDAALGPFSLQPGQVPPGNAFVHLGTLQEAAQRPGRANLLLVAEGPTPAAASAALRQAWRPEDGELELQARPDRGCVELRTSRVFLDEPVAAAALALASKSQAIVTYFVNELRAGDRATPYSMVCAADPPLTPADLGPDEIVVNEWLANDLALRPGSPVEIAYYAVGTARRLEEKRAQFRVRSVVPLAGPFADRDLMPAFPGIEQAESTRDWDPSLPVVLDRIRDADDQYWKDHRGTPKAFVSLAAGRALWSNRFGTLTAIRYPSADPSADQAALQARAAAALPPSMFGVAFEPVRAQALAAAAQSQDFGGLFLGFSLFLIVSALLLMALLFQFAVEQRAEETGTLLALGFTPARVRRLLLWEGAALALTGGVAGMAGGVFYAQAMIRGLSTLWRDAVGTSSLVYHSAPATLLIGGLAGAAVAWITIALVLRRQARRPARELLAAGAGSLAPPVASQSGGRRDRWLAAGAAAGALLLVLATALQGETASAGAFFGAGSLLLLALLSAASAGLRHLAGSETPLSLSWAGLGLRGTARRRGRSLATIGLLACGSFLIASIGVFRLDAVREAWKRSSGTGGFALFGESTLPVVVDLNASGGREAYALEARDLEGVSVVPFRVRDGDDASCLNLNRAQKPRLLGVPTSALAERDAFRFAQAAPGLDRSRGWRLLDGDRAGPTPAAAEVPAIGDLNSILWAMGRKVGDVIPYVDERGRSFRVRIVGAVANSILQGSLLIDEQAFLERFPSEPGYRMFLVDAPSNRVTQVSAVLTRGLRNTGLELLPAADRLAAFNAVQNTYLGTFQVLGGLGLVLGSVGLGVLLLRNALERRGELALLLAVGFRPRAVRRLVLSEHGALLLAGLAAGLAAAAVAVLPNLLSPRAELPYVSLGLTLGGVLVCGLACTWLAAGLAVRGRLLTALRNE